MRDGEFTGAERRALDNWITGGGDGGYTDRSRSRGEGPRDEPASPGDLTGEQAAAYIVATLRRYKVAVSREVLLLEFCGSLDACVFECEAAFNRGLRYVRKHGLAAPTRRHASRPSLWIDTGGE